MWLILKIIGAIVVYLAIGVFVAFKFFSKHSVPIGAVPVIIISPLFWPILAISMLVDGIKKRRERKAAYKRMHSR